jgi:hypothetical protein
MSGPRRRCADGGRLAGVGRHLTVVQSAPVPWPADPPHWQAQVVLLSEPSRCMVSGRRCDRLALRLTNVLDPIDRSVILDLATVAALVDTGLTILEAGLASIEEPEPDN